MQLLLPCWIFLAVGGLEFDELDLTPSSDASHDPTLFNDENIFDKLTESPSNIFLDDNGQSSFNTQLTSDVLFDDGAWPANILLADNNDPNQPVENYPDFLITGSDNCVGSVDDYQLFGKIRRGESCRTPPVGQAENPDQPQEDSNSPNNDAPSMNPYTSVLARGLQRNLEICPIMIFGLSNIPVCKGLNEPEDFQQIGPNLFNIAYVLPRTSPHPLFFLFWFTPTTDSTTNTNQFCPALLMLKDCTPGETLFCCKYIVITVRKVDPAMAGWSSKLS